MSDVMGFLSQSSRKGKFVNMRKRVYDVLNIFVSLNLLKKVYSSFKILPRKSNGSRLLTASQTKKGPGHFLSPKENEFLTRVEAMKKVRDKVQEKQEREAKLRKKLAVLRNLCASNQERQNCRLLTGKELLEEGVKGRTKKIEKTKDSELRLNVPFTVLELRSNPVILAAKKSARLDIKKRWNFLHLFDFVLGNK